ncbi:hypothetical protein [Diaminobutyricibacter sp. McL0608]|uniref:hypothetical protein n=1 Tax=Leifsonia sp. McL0608 TaxID=3143537 RepID=UPI0031F2F2AD
MSDTSDDEIVVTDGRTTEGRATEGRRLYRWLLDHLAKFPGRVTVVTFAAGVVVTLFVVVVGGDSSPTTVVSLIATLWALFFAVMIYLLTARDTDKVLEQIADLHEQLATALTNSPAPGRVIRGRTGSGYWRPSAGAGGWSSRRVRRESA